MPEQGARAPVIAAGHDPASVTQAISSVVLGRTPRWWYVATAVSFLLVVVLLGAVSYLFAKGVGVWGLDVPVAWGFAIVNFVWWIGIGHAGTLISAVLLLLRQEWRVSVNRFAEAMTLFAVTCAGLFPILHLGRPWLAYWLLPYPNTMELWPQFRSPLVWDVFAVTTYAVVSLLFWYVGLLPDLATLRDRARHPLVRRAYGVLAMGWRGAARHWHHHHAAYLLLAGLATPLVVSVHSVVSFDFAVSQLPGWHSLVFPPYFVAGAVFAGFAMVVTLAIPLRRLFGLHDFITERHVDNMAKVMLATGLVVAYGYLMEGFTAWYSGEEVERFALHQRLSGPRAGTWAALLACNVLAIQVLWSRRVRHSAVAVWVVAVVVDVGMWLERFLIVVGSLERDFLPSSWGRFEPTVWDWATLLGSLGLFMLLLLLFIRFLPAVSMAELRTLTPEGRSAPPEGRS